MYKQGNPDNEVLNQTGGYQPSQPSQRFPFNPISPPRSDNANQPWYAGARPWSMSPDTIQDHNAVLESSPDGFAHSTMSSIWNAFAQFHGPTSPKSNLLDTAGTDQRGSR